MAIMPADRGAPDHGLVPWFDAFVSAARSGDPGAVAACFMADGYWRDLLALTWDIRTFSGAAEIATLAPFGPALRGLRLDGVPIAGRAGHLGETIESFFAFETEAGIGRGYVRLLRDASGGYGVRALSLVTALRGLKGFPERIGADRRLYEAGAQNRSRRNWVDRRDSERRFGDRDPDVLIVGAGQAGLMLAARLVNLGVDTLVVDTMRRVGDNWRNRYHSLELHNTTQSNHLPYMPFPESWPVYLTKDMVATWFELYAVCMEINVWTETAFLGASHDDTGSIWEARVRLADGSIRTLRPRHIVLATGVNGVPKAPEIRGLDVFRGTVVHSSRFDSAMDVQGKAALVVGAGNSAHDVAQELHLRGAGVTMLQRSSITVASVEPSAASLARVFSDNEGVRPLDDIDLMTASIPFDLVRRLHGPLSKALAENDKALLDGLRRVGFRLDNGVDDTGFYMKLIRSLGGYYLNVGASDLIVEGRIKLRHSELDHLTADEAAFADGSRMRADLVVLATGWMPLQDSVARLFGRATAERVGPIWGLGEKGELRNMWSRTAQPGLFIACGTLTMCRNYSRATALLIKASLEGILPDVEAARVPALAEQEHA